MVGTEGRTEAGRLERVPELAHMILGGKKTVNGVFMEQGSARECFGREYLEHAQTNDRMRRGAVR